VYSPAVTTSTDQTGAANWLNPDYCDRLEDWVKMAHCYGGQRRVKDQGETYLNPTAGMRRAGFPNANTPGAAAYDAYRMRARFPDYCYRAVCGLVGIVHASAPVIELPDALEPMHKSATIAGESLETLWMRITAAQLIYGRHGLLLEVGSGLKVDEALPFIVPYNAVSIVNWDKGQRTQGREELELVVLDESGLERKQNLQFEFVRRYRIVARADVAATIGMVDQSQAAGGEYVAAVVNVTEGGQLSGAQFIAPQIGGVSLDHIPFAFINTNDLVPATDLPPLLGLADLSLAIYRGDADHRHALYASAQDTLVRTGATEEQQNLPVGAGAVVDVPIGGDAKYIGPESAGLSEMRESKKEDKQEAEGFVLQMLDSSGREAESGEALRIRVAARMATLYSLQNTAAQALTDIMTSAGEWMGLPASELAKIVIKPNLDFGDVKANTQALRELMDAKIKGAPLSDRTIHGWARNNGFTEMAFEEEIEELVREEMDRPGGDAGINIDPTQSPTE